MKYSFSVAVHRDETVLESTFLKSPIFADGKTTPNILRNHDSVAIAYTQAIEGATTDIVVFAHPDVYFPGNWHKSFTKALEWLEENDPNWGVIGLYGVNHSGKGTGFTYTSGRGGFIGQPFSEPSKVATLDEFVFAVRKDGPLKFDTQLPSAQFQLGTTDLCMQAAQRNMSNYALPCFVIHNSNRWNSLPLSFWKCYLYIRKKWRKVLPIKAPYSEIRRSCKPMLISSLNHIYKKTRGRFRETTRVDDPAALYHRLEEGLLNYFPKK